jgi:hypothetical protein
MRGNSQAKIALLCALHLYQGCSISKGSKVTKLKDVVTTLNTDHLLHDHFSPQSPSMLMHVTDLGTSLKTVTAEIGYIYIHSHSLTVIFSSLLLRHRRHPSVASAAETNLSRGVILQHDNATPHSASRTQVPLQSFHWEQLDSQPYCLGC